MDMESYEDFCLRSLARLQTESQGKSQGQQTGSEPTGPVEALSFIHFHGRPVLSPVLSVEQRSEMSQYRQRAAQLEVDRQALRSSSLLTRVQDILDNAQVDRVPEMEGKMDLPTAPYCLSPKPETVNGYTLVTDSPGLPRGAGVVGLHITDRPTTPQPESPIVLNGFQSLLRRSREYVEREQAQRGSKVIGRVTSTTPPAESLSDKENESRSPLGEMKPEQGYSLRHSPLNPPQTQAHIQHQSQYPAPAQAQYQAVCDPYDSRFSCLSSGLPDPYALLPSPEPSMSPRPHRRRPRPVSTGNIMISFPIGSADLIPRGLVGRHQESAVVMATGVMRSPERGSGVSDSSSSRRGSQCGTSPVQEKSCSPVSTSGTGSHGHHDVISSGFRRRCHTLDSQLHSSHSASGPGMDRSQERLPRFMGGVPRLALSRRSPAVPLNQSYEVENPSATLLRPHVRPLTPDLSPCQMSLEPEGPQGPHDGRITPSSSLEEQDSKTEETQRRVSALEEMQRRLEEEHALQMSLLMAEQEREQQRLCQELDEKGKRLREQGCGRLLSGDGGGLSPSCPGLSPTLSATDRSPRHSVHSMGFSSPLSSSAPSPSMQPPVYLWGPTWGASKPRGRLSQVVTVEQQRALCRLGAISCGFLTRRLLQTEKVKQLRQTVQDTQEFIRSFQTEAPQKRGSISAQDLSLQERVRAQLRAARYDVHDIFFEMPLEERLALLQLDREVRTEKKLREMEKARIPNDRVLSAATQRSLDRKKRVGESPGQARKVQKKPKSPPTNRILKPSQGQNASVPGADVSHLGADVSHLGADVSHLGADVSHLGADVSHLGADVSHLGADVSYLGADVSHLGADVSHLGADVSHLGADVSHLGADVSHLGADVSHLGADVSHLGADVSHLGADVSHLGADVSHLGADVSHLGADVSYLGADVSHLGQSWVGYSIH
ncbi:centriolar coiled-coil protein of 110 kDa-like [Salvelinus namaycush]|uniref:Centriolar coiled-coil protein of 110 kDa-like n=1 Tax=Salvelinus namaycush TaxID=8040 RepID=A0A8U0QMR7_SALNM|nr:centriolar coiled-coil protein of 110 kDa-like [Salvelinus namaycush]